MSPEIPGELLYTKEHEWLREEGDFAVVGITAYAQDSLGDIVHVELPSKGTKFAKDTSFGVVESVKSVSDLYAPVSCSVIDVNDALLESPELLNEDPYGEAWLIRVKITDPEELGELLDATAYETLLEEMAE
ncbi:MAG: glycine cleavage system protein H [Deltaproteobacteria bacterium RIFOXYA12_FULL_61_11]|nr:MAG: glycine cleavage system protein H [Deltaproteobacteria bacterium RIFOXYA12_FULL_61_11]